MLALSTLPILGHCSTNLASTYSLFDIQPRPLKEWNGSKLVLKDYSAAVEAGGKTVPLDYSTEIDADSIVGGTLLPGGQVMVAGNIQGLVGFDAAVPSLITEFARGF